MTLAWATSPTHQEPSGFGSVMDMLIILVLLCRVGRSLGHSAAGAAGGATRGAGAGDGAGGGAGAGAGAGDGAGAAAEGMVVTTTGECIKGHTMRRSECSASGSSNIVNR